MCPSHCRFVYTDRVVRKLFCFLFGTSRQLLAGAEALDHEHRPDV